MAWNIRDKQFSPNMKIIQPATSTEQSFNCASQNLREQKEKLKDVFNKYKQVLHLCVHILNLIS
jgi:hypothetical protein